MKRISFLILTALVSTSAFAQKAWISNWSTSKIGGNITVNNSATESIQLAGPAYIKNIVVQAEGLSQQSTIEVMVNGQVKGTIFAPGRDPSYVVTIAETTRSVEFRYRDGGSMRILSVVATMASVYGQPGYYSGLGGSYYGGSRATLVDIANKALFQLDKLQTYANLADYATYLFPIKRHAGMVYVMATSHGDLSRKTTAQLVALSDQIAFADAYLTQLMQLDQAFEPVVELLAVKETIKGLLQ